MAATKPNGRQPSLEAGLVIVDAVQTDLWSQSIGVAFGTVAASHRLSARLAAALCPSLPSE